MHNISLKHDSIWVALHFDHQMASQQMYTEFELNYEIPERRFVGIQNILLSKSKLYLTSQRQFAS